MPTLRWVRMNRYEELTGDTADAVEKRVRTGKWLRDIHVRRPEGSAAWWVSEGEGLGFDRPPRRYGMTRLWAQEKVG